MSETIKVKDESDDAMVTLDANARVTFVDINTIQVERKGEYPKSHIIGIDGVRRVRSWLAQNGLSRYDRTIFNVIDSMSGVPYQLVYESIRRIEWEPGPLDKLNRKAVVYYKAGSILKFNLKNADADAVVGWMMRNGAVHGQVPERRLRPARMRVNVPAGFKLVPEKPTPEWIEAILKVATPEWIEAALARCGDEQRKQIAFSLSTILDAAPPPPDSLVGFYDGPLGAPYAGDPLDDSGIVRVSLNGGAE